MARLMPGIRKDTKRGTYYFVIDATKPGDVKRKQIKRRGFATKEDASSAMIALKNEIMQGTYIEPSHMPYSEFLQEWLESKRVKESTFETYKWLVSRHISPGLGHHKLNEISPRIIDKFYNTLYREGKLSDSMIQKIHTMIKDSLKQAVNYDLIARNPADRVKRPQISEAREIQVWTINQVKRFLVEAAKDALYVCFLLAILTGLRRGEILALRWKDIDWDSGTIRVKQTLSRDGKKIINSTKTRSSRRTVEVSTEVLDILRDQQLRVLIQKKENANLYRDFDLVICTSIGTPIDPNNLRRSFKRIIQNCNGEVPDIRFHDLRHTHASLLLANNVNIKVVQERLGHANVKITLDTYSHLLPGMQKEAAEKISNIVLK